MKNQFTLEEKQALVKRYRSGEAVKKLCEETGTSKSSLYEWAKLYRETETQAGYICAVIDLFYREVIARGVSQKNSTRPITSALKQAMKERHPENRLVFHSDQGARYTA